MALKETSRELLLRVRKEADRPPETAGTHLVGGMAKVGAALDGFLRDLVNHCATLANESTASWIADAGLRVSFSKLAAGQAATIISNVGRGLRNADAATAMLVSDLTLRKEVSRLWRVIGFRNVAVHEARLQAERVAALRDLAALVDSYRRKSGW